VIGDPIVRATYIQDCAVRLGYSEQTLTAKMNENIRGMRANQRLQTTDQPAAPASKAQENQVETQPKEEEKKQEINVNTLSSLIIKMVIKHGGIVIFDNVETEDGDTISFTLAEWIDYNLKQDGLQFAESIYNQILKEAVEHSKDENFDSEKYFTLHPDYDISSISIKLCADNVILSKSLQMEVTPYILREQAEHLLLDFLNEYLMQRINQLTTEIKQAGDDMDKQMTLIGELQNVQKMRMQISQKTGTSVITRRV
jgi:DNA primase